MAGLKFRVLLDSETKKEVFRDILISDESNFEVFYQTILESYGFNGDQMASFYVSNDDWDKGQEITLTDMTFGEDPESPSIMSEEKIKNFIEQPDQKLILVHDFMRLWIFLIELIGFDKKDPAAPTVVLSVGEAPKEDSRTAEDNDDLFLGDVEDEDEFGFDEFDDDLSDEDYSSFDDYEY
jgi:hypothetical protein